MLDTLTPALDVADTVLQSSDPDWLQYWKDGDWFNATFRPLVWRLGEEGVTLLIAAPFTLALWQQTETIRIPAIMLVMFLGLLLGGAPAGAALGGYLMVVLAVLGTYYAIYDGNGR